MLINQQALKHNESLKTMITSHLPIIYNQLITCPVWQRPTVIVMSISYNILTLQLVSYWWCRRQASDKSAAYYYECVTLKHSYMSSKHTLPSNTLALMHRMLSGSFITCIVQATYLSMINDVLFLIYRKKYISHTTKNYSCIYNKIC